MVGAAEPTPANSTEERARRMIDCAAELLERWGYRRVTVEDIARRAGIGKGTVYLHWRTKDDLFSAVLLRDALSVMTDVVGALRADPAEVRLSALARRQLLAVLAKPLYRAFYVRDRDVLGRLASGFPALHDYHAEIRSIYERYFAILSESKLIRPDCECALVMSAMDAMATGLVMQWANGPDPTPSDVAKMAGDVLSDTIARAFEPDEQPTTESVVDAAGQVIDLFDEFVARRRAILQ